MIKDFHFHLLCLFVSIQWFYWIGGLYQPEYWINIIISADAELNELDEILRDLWLECCGHASEFKYSISVSDLKNKELKAKAYSLSLSLYSLPCNP